MKSIKGLLRLLSNQWRFVEFWEYTNPLWYLMNIFWTIAVIIAIFLKPLYELYRYLKDLHWLKYKLPKQNIKFFKDSIVGWERWENSSKNVDKLRKKYPLHYKQYLYSNKRVLQDKIYNKPYFITPPKWNNIIKNSK